MRGPAAATSARPSSPSQPLLLREPGSATRLVTERALASAGVAYRPGMVLPHTEAIKQGVIAGLGVAFVSVYAIQGEGTGRLRPLRVRGLRIVRTFHLIHHDRRPLSAAARAFTELRGRARARADDASGRAARPLAVRGRRVGARSMPALRRPSGRARRTARPVVPMRNRSAARQRAGSARSSWTVAGLDPPP